MFPTAQHPKSGSVAKGNNETTPVYSLHSQRAFRHVHGSPGKKKEGKRVLALKTVTQDDGVVLDKILKKCTRHAPCVSFHASHV